MIKRVKSVLTIAGSDPSGGAGIQADIKTIAAHGAYAMSVITALTAQNTTGVFDVSNVAPEFVAAQLDAVFTDIFPDAVKIGMISSAAIADVIREKLAQYGAKNVVADPVMVATSGGVLISPDAMDALRALLATADVITPNMAEAAALAGFKVETKADMLRAAEVLSMRTRGAVLVKGGHLLDCADDYLLSSEGGCWLAGERIETKNTHGTGCTLSSAIACGLAEGLPINKAVAKAKEYLTRALAFGLTLGHGNGPLWHGAGRDEASC